MRIIIILLILSSYSFSCQMKEKTKSLTAETISNAIIKWIDTKDEFITSTTVNKLSAVQKDADNFTIEGKKLIDLSDILIIHIDWMQTEMN